VGNEEVPSEQEIDCSVDGSGMGRVASLPLFPSVQALFSTGQDKHRDSVSERDLSARLILEQKLTKETKKNQFPFLLW
jgi:hypothetical protein